MVVTQRAKKIWELVFTTGIGGVFFLLPLFVVGAFFVQLVEVAIYAARSLEGIVPIESVGGYAMLVTVGMAAILAICFAAGLVAKRSIAKQFTEQVEKFLQIAFPRYAIVKDRISGNIGGKHFRADLKTVWILEIDRSYRIGFAVECVDADWVTVYVPGAPDPWTGEVRVFAREKLKWVDVDFITAMTSLEKLGRDLQSAAAFSFRLTASD